MSFAKVAIFVASVCIFAEAYHQEVPISQKKTKHQVPDKLNKAVNLIQTDESLNPIYVSDDWQSGKSGSDY